MQAPLQGTKVAILVTDNFEQVEMTGPREALQQAGAMTTLIAEKPGEVQGFRHDTKGDRFSVELTLADADPDDYDAVLLPGGALNSDYIRALPQAQDFVRKLDRAGKPVAAICHGAWLLVSAKLVPGHTLTAWPSIRDDINNAGGEWVDREVVVDKNWITSRKPADIPSFSRKFIDALSQRGLQPSPDPARA